MGFPPAFISLSAAAAADDVTNGIFQLWRQFRFSLISRCQKEFFQCNPDRDCRILTGIPGVIKSANPVKPFPAPQIFMTNSSPRWFSFSFGLKRVDFLGPGRLEFNIPPAMSSRLALKILSGRAENSSGPEISKHTYSCKSN